MIKENEIVFGRPLHDFNNKEIFYFCHINNLIVYTFDRFDFLEEMKNEKEKNMIGRGSINTLINQLVYKLSDEHPGSSFTILKTIEKLKQI